jgi:hypothetical protein
MAQQWQNMQNINENIERKRKAKIMAKRKLA